jgi:hypothetical protein
MSFRNRFKDPKRSVAIGMACLVVGLLTPMFFRPTTQLAKDLVDGLDGFMLGVSIVIMLMSVVTANRQRCAKN